MFCIIDHSTDPYWNLAAEEYLFKNFDAPVFRLWQNDNAIIIGQHQNALAEINLDYVRQNGIKVVRRLTGGGAVFHDLGNVNFTFIDNRIDEEDSATMFARFTKPIIDALGKLGVKAYLEGRNDLLIDGKKFSGNAVAVYRDRVLQHGTLLFSSSMNTLSNALASRPEKFVSKSIKSNIARVTNIGEHLAQPMTIRDFTDFMEREINSINQNLYKLYTYSDQDLKAIEKLRDEKYSQDWWNYGSSPNYQYSKVKQFPGGLIEVYLKVNKGRISDIKIYGSYFFLKETQEIENILAGAEHTPEGIGARLKKINLSDYFNNVAREEFLSLFWD
ncbi:MAG: lipoate--protein ligase [Rikenellaceae bacterium]